MMEQNNVEYNMYVQPSFGHYGVPIVIAWIFFVFELFFLLIGRTSLMAIFIQLIIAIFVTVGIKFRDYFCYKLD